MAVIEVAGRRKDYRGLLGGRTRALDGLPDWCSWGYLVVVVAGTAAVFARRDVA